MHSTIIVQIQKLTLILAYPEVSEIQLTICPHAFLSTYLTKLIFLKNLTKTLLSICWILPQQGKEVNIRVSWSSCCYFCSCPIENGHGCCDTVEKNFSGNVMEMIILGSQPLLIFSMGRGMKCTLQILVSF